MLMVCAPVTVQASVVPWSLVILAGVAVKLEIVGSGAAGGGVGPPDSPQTSARTTGNTSATTRTGLAICVFMIRSGVNDRGTMAPWVGLRAAPAHQGIRIV